MKATKKANDEAHTSHDISLECPYQSVRVRPAAYQQEKKDMRQKKRQVHGMAWMMVGGEWIEDVEALSREIDLLKAL